MFAIAGVADEVVVALLAVEAVVAGSTEPHPANRAIESTGGAFVEEVRGSLDYYLAQPGAARIGRVVLSGGGSRLGGLVERLTAATRLPVEVARPLSVMTIGKTGLTEEQIRDLLDKAGLRPRDVLRRREPLVAELGLDDEDALSDDASLITLIAEHPRLLQRPIVVRGDRALLARPVDRVLELLD